VRITAGSREVPGRNACDRRHTYRIIIIIIIFELTNTHLVFFRVMTLLNGGWVGTNIKDKYLVFIYLLTFFII